MNTFCAFFFFNTNTRAIGAENSDFATCWLSVGCIFFMFFTFFMSYAPCVGADPVSARLNGSLIRGRQTVLLPSFQKGGQTWGSAPTVGCKSLNILFTDIKPCITAVPYQGALNLPFRHFKP